jgi:hypothetical protein
MPELERIQSFSYSQSSSLGSDGDFILKHGHVFELSPPFSGVPIIGWSVFFGLV